MRVQHVGLALLIVVLWMLSFLAVKLGLRDMPPLALSTVRLLLTSLPWILILPRPSVSLYKVALYGILMFAMQLGLLAVAIHQGVPAGMAAVLLQVHVFVTAALAAVFLRERPSRWQILGSLISFSGLGLVAMHVGSAAGGFSVLSLLLMLLAASAWGTANIVSKHLGPVNLLALIAWGSLFAWPPLLLASLVLEGPELVVHSFRNLSGVGVSSMFYMAYFGTFLAYALWSKLLQLYPATQVAPFTLLVPVLTILSSAVVLDEPLLPWKLAAAALVLAGVLVATFGARITSYFRRSSASTG
ncbi:EamA family transporter [Comamonas sp. GB3 AK4-5]|uniref:EamA family transporter n=1 Tax=Comamonas sp. GB3 AK4-5 TaxID=3231487 RepID=UPI00351E4B60